MSEKRKTIPWGINDAEVVLCERCLCIVGESDECLCLLNQMMVDDVVEEVTAMDIVARIRGAMGSSSSSSAAQGCGADQCCGGGCG